MILYNSSIARSAGHGLHTKDEMRRKTKSIALAQDNIEELEVCDKRSIIGC
jgi:hypothetical protein